MVMGLSVAQSSNGQLPEKMAKKMGPNPVLFRDSVEITIDTLKAISPFDVADISIVIPKKAKKFLGDKGADGAVYVTTIKAAKLRNWNYLNSKSDKYNKAITSPDADTLCQYVLNKRSLTEKEAPGTIFLIRDKNFKRLNFIVNGVVSEDSAHTKQFQVYLFAKRPKGLLKNEKW